MKSKSAILPALPVAFGILLLPQPAAANPGAALNIIGSICSIAGAAVSAYQLSSCNNSLSGNIAKSTLSYSGDRFRFSLGFAGGDFDSDSSYILSGIFGDGVLGANNVFAVTEPWWSWQISVTEDAGFVNDVLSINGFIKHVLADPHKNVDVAAAPPLNFNLIVDADDAVNGKVSASAPFKRVDHPSNVTPSHTDDLVSAVLTATVTSTLFVDDITGYTFTSQAVHCNDCPVPLPVPPLTADVPGPLPICGLGIAFRYTRKLRSLSKKVHGNICSNLM